MGKDDFLPMFTVKTKCFYPKTQKAFELMEEVVFESRLDDKKRLKEIMGQIYTNLKMMLTESGHKTAANPAMSYFSGYAQYKEEIQGISMFESIKNWYENFDEEYENIVNGLEEARKAIFQKQNLIVSYTGKEEKPEFMAESLSHFAERLYPDQEENIRCSCGMPSEK